MVPVLSAVAKRSWLAGRAACSRLASHTCDAALQDGAFGLLTVDNRASAHHCGYRSLLCSHDLTLLALALTAVWLAHWLPTCCHPAHQELQLAAVSSASSPLHLAGAPTEQHMSKACLFDATLQAVTCFELISMHDTRVHVL